MEKERPETFAITLNRNVSSLWCPFAGHRSARRRPSPKNQKIVHSPAQRTPHFPQIGFLSQNAASVLPPGRRLFPPSLVQKTRISAQKCTKTRSPNPPRRYPRSGPVRFFPNHHLCKQSKIVHKNAQRARQSSFFQEPPLPPPCYSRSFAFIRCARTSLADLVS